MSKRARKAWFEREAALLFPPGTFDPPPATEAEQRANRSETLRRSATNLRALAARGMTPLKYRREADRLEAEAATLEVPPCVD